MRKNNKKWHERNKKSLKLARKVKKSARKLLRKVLKETKSMFIFGESARGCAGKATTFENNISQKAHILVCVYIQVLCICGYKTLIVTCLQGYMSLFENGTLS